MRTPTQVPMSPVDPVLQTLQTILAQAKSGAIASARDRLKSLLVSHPTHAEVHSLAASLAEKAGAESEALAHLERAAELAPTQPDHAITLGRLQLKTGNLAATLQTASNLLEKHPSEVRGWSLMARALTRMRKLPEAQDAVAQALKLAPHNPAILYQMGNICFQQSNYTTALEYFEAAHVGRPDSPEILNDLGSARLALGDIDGAIDALKQATVVQPDFAMAFANLGGALAYRGEIGTPLKAFVKATRLAPNNPRIWLKMGRTLLNQGHLKIAEKCLQRVLKLTPENRQAQAALGALLERSGRYPEAVEILQPLVDAEVHDANAAVSWATTCMRLGRSKEAIPILESYQARPVSQPERVLLGHALGDLYEKNGQHAQAFAAHAHANEVHDLHFNPEQFSQSIDEIIQTFSAESFERRARASIVDPSPVLIVGMPRSGTSLVEQIIDSHSQAAGAGELEMLRQLAGSLARKAKAKNWPVPMDGLTTALADRLSRIYQARIHQVDPEALRITDKMPTNFLNLGLAAHLLPGARIIHCTRDPLDTAISCYFKLFNFGYAFSTRLDWLGHFTMGYQKLMNHWEDVLPLPILTVPYEDLIQDLESGTRRILNFLELPWEAECLRFYENQRPVKTASYAQVRQPIYRSSMGRAQFYSEWLGPLQQVLESGKL